MHAIHLMAAGVDPQHAENTVAVNLLDRLSAILARVFGLSCRVRQEVHVAAHAFDRMRRQYHSTAILKELEPLARAEGVRLLAVTELDLYVPVLTFVFGEAQLAGPCAVVSLHRLREEFYGLPPNPGLLLDRLAKEAVHELGHTFGLRHCPDWRCVMASTHAVERLDLKEADFCASCRAALDGAPGF